MKIIRRQGIQITRIDDHFQPLRVFRGHEHLYWDDDYQSLLHESPIGRFLPRAVRSPERGDPEMATYSMMDGSLELASKSSKISRWGASKIELDALDAALTEFAQLAEDPKADPNKREFIKQFKLPHPEHMPEAWRVTSQGRIIVLWGYERNMPGVETLIGACTPEGRRSIINSLANSGPGAWLKKLWWILLMLLILLLLFLYWLMPRPLADFKIENAAVTDNSNYNGKSHPGKEGSWWYGSGFRLSPEVPSQGTEFKLTATNTLLHIPFIWKSDIVPGALHPVPSFGGGGTGGGGTGGGDIAGKGTGGGDTAGKGTGGGDTAGKGTGGGDTAGKGTGGGDQSNAQVEPVHGGISLNHTVKASNTPGMRDAELNVSADGEIVECEWVVDGKKLPDSGPKVTVPLKPGKHDVGVNVKYKNKDGKESKASVVKPIDVPASNAPLSAKLDGPGVCKLAEPCTFIVLTDKAWGTGFAMTPDGYILTNKHVIGDADKVWIAHRSWGDQPVPAEVVKLSPNKDLALLKVPKKFTSYLHPAGTPEKGTTVYAVGYPGTGIERPKDFPPSPQIDRGDISHNDRELDGVSCLQTNAPVNPGNSGGPLLDETGHVVGVVTFAMKGLQGTNGAIKIQEALKEFPQLTR